MKLNSIDIQNVLGARRVAIDLATPITVLAAPNGNGKTSTLEAVRMALTGIVPRGVKFKKDYAQLITEGQASGQATVQVDGRECWMTMPNGKGEHLDLPALPFVLDATRFAALVENDRKTFLFNLMGVKVDKADLKQRLAKRGVDTAKAERVLPLLRGTSGFEEAAKSAAEQATLAKGAWKAVTGEQWGSEKAIDWRAEVPAFQQSELDALLESAKDTDQALATANQNVGAIQAQIQHHAKQEQARAGLQDAAGKIDRIKTKLATDEQSLREWQADLEKTEAAAGTAPRVGIVHGLAQALDQALEHVPSNHLHLPRWEGVLRQYEAEHGSVRTVAGGDDAAARRLPSIRSSVELTERAVANDRRDLAAAEAAKAQLEAMDADAGKAPKESELQAAKDAAASVQAARADLTKQIDALNAVKRAAADADANTKKAGEHHADVVAWLAVAEALGPKGVPGELLAEALSPFNSRLAQNAEDTGWPVVKVSDEMAITYGGRLHQLLSKSEKWRADAMLTEAISNLSGLRLLVLDEMDILDMTGRGQCLGWLDTLAINNEVDSVLVGATLKSATANWAASTSAFWIAQGVCEAAAALEAA